MSENIFDSLKKNKNKSAGEKKRKSRELSPVKFPFSDDEDSDEVFLKRPTKPIGKKQQISATTKTLLSCMRKCAVKLPLDKNGRRNYRIPDIKKPRKLVVRLNKNSVKSLTKGKPSKVLEKLGKSQETKKQTAKVYVKFPLSTPNSNRKKKSYVRTPRKAQSSDSAMKESKPFKRLHATPPLVREFGKRFFMSYVAVENCNFQMMMKNPKVGVSPPKKKKLNSSVRFSETVEVFGSSSSDEDLSDPMPVSLVTAINGGDDFDITTPSPNQKGKRSLSLKKKPILTPAAKKNYRLSDEKKISHDVDVEEDEDAEYIIPTEISPLKKQLSPSHHASTQESASPLRSEPTLYDDYSEKSGENIETITDDVEQEIEITTTSAAAKTTTTEKFEVGKDKESTPEVTESVQELSPEPMNEDENDERMYSSIQETSNNEEDKTDDDSKNHSHNVFEDDDSQGQNIVQDFISRTVQDLSHDDSEDIQDDEELVDEKRSSPPSAATNDDDSVSSKISRLCQNVKQHVLGIRNVSQGKDTDNENAEGI